MSAASELSAALQRQRVDPQKGSGPAHTFTLPAETQAARVALSYDTVAWTDLVLSQVSVPTLLASPTFHSPSPA